VNMFGASVTSRIHRPDIETAHAAPDADGAWARRRLEERGAAPAGATIHRAHPSPNTPFRSTKPFAAEQIDKGRQRPNAPLGNVTRPPERMQSTRSRPNSSGSVSNVVWPAIQRNRTASANHRKKEVRACRPVTPRQTVSRPVAKPAKATRITPNTRYTKPNRNFCHESVSDKKAKSAQAQGALRLQPHRLPQNSTSAKAPTSPRTGLDQHVCPKLIPSCREPQLAV